MAIVQPKPLVQHQPRPRPRPTMMTAMPIGGASTTRRLFLRREKTAKGRVVPAKTAISTFIFWSTETGPKKIWTARRSKML